MEHTHDRQRAEQTLNNAPTNHSSTPLGFKLSLFWPLLLAPLLPPLYPVRESLFPPWLCICVVLTLISYAGNLDRRWWLHALTATFASPILYKIFWPLRDFYWDNVWVAWTTIVPLILTMMHSWVYSPSTIVFVPKTQLPKALPTRAIPIPLSDGPGDFFPPLIWHSAKRPSWLTRSRPSGLNASRYPVLDPKDSCLSYSAIQEEERRMRKVAWRDLRTRPKKHYPRLWFLSSAAVERPDSFDEDYDVTPAYKFKAPRSPAGAFDLQEDMDTENPRTLISRTLRTPLSAAKLEHFVVPEGPSPLVMEVQVLSAWKPIGNWLCDPAVTSDEKWATVRDTIGSLKRTSIHLQKKRIARYNIGTSADTTEIVLGPMHLSMHDLLDFFNLAVHHEERVDGRLKHLEEFGREYRGILGDVVVELVRMARDYPQNYLVGSMIKLAAKIKIAVSRWPVKELEWLSADETPGERTVNMPETVELTISEACAIIDDWHHICQMWKVMGASRFESMVRQQYPEPTSSLARMARQMLRLRGLFSHLHVERADMLLSERYQTELASVVAVMEKRMKGLGDLAAQSQFDKLVAGVKQCAESLKRSNDTFVASVSAIRHTKKSAEEIAIAENDAAGQNVFKAASHAPGDPVAKAKEDFMAKILDLGREALKDQVEHQNQQARDRAAKLLENIEEFDGRPHARRRLKGLGQTRYVIADSNDDGLPDDKVDMGGKRQYGNTHTQEEKREVVARENTRQVGRKFWRTKQWSSERAALMTGGLQGFDQLVAMNKFNMQETQTNGAVRCLTEMDLAMDAADEVVEEMEFVQQQQQPFGWPESRSSSPTPPESHTGENTSLPAGVGAAPGKPSPRNPPVGKSIAGSVALGTRRPPAPTVEDVEGSDEEL